MPPNARSMLRPLSIAGLTFFLLGSYYSHAREAAEEAKAEAESRRIARSAALVGANRAKEALAERWVDRRLSGAHDGGTYRVVAVVRRDRGAINSRGSVEAAGRRAAVYRVRLDVRRRLKDASDPTAGYVFTFASPERPS